MLILDFGLVGAAELRVLVVVTAAGAMVEIVFLSKGDKKLK